MGLVETVKALIKADKTLVDKITSATRIELKYTLRLKKKEEWITQLIIDGNIIAIEHESAELDEEQADKLLKQRAKDIRTCFTEINHQYYPPIMRYYMK